MIIGTYACSACLLKFQGIVKVGAVDADQHKSMGGQYGVRGFPTIKIFGANKNKPEEYQGTDNYQSQMAPKAYSILFYSVGLVLA